MLYVWQKVVFTNYLLWIAYKETYIKTSVLHLSELPGKPGTPDVSDIKATSAFLNWTAPDSDGGAEIFNYVVEARKEGKLEWSKVTEKKVPKCELKATGEFTLC